MTDQPALPGMGHVVPDAPHVMIREVTHENIPLIAKESGRDEVELTAMLIAREENGGTLRVKYLALNYHNHKPTNHRDGKPRWCDECGLTGDGQTPEKKEADSWSHPYQYACPEEGCFYVVGTDTQELLDIRIDIHQEMTHRVKTVEPIENQE